ncbi:glycosyltransferase family 2 protein [Flavobacterium circumlabens]|uniref:Glycosyltransferase family 2 protein n=2 Tax=Flavobacterium circumlabens TaxID=2133765 RepID=A0A4Y7UD69_9FLAO|nr:glycosyltransferase family A protein [Flavobacterium circumlabens]TEB43789.1 glycosyltransferase family 2 protein [Flavobacterium circumlabens]
MKMLNVFSEKDFEILIATKDRSNFDFLLPMFPFEHFSNFNILIINQSLNKVLSSDFDSVRVINSTEKGLSKSRNTAIQNASKKICLISDDDVVFAENFRKDILLAFQNQEKADIITFNHQRIGAVQPQKKWDSAFRHTSKTIWNVSSIEIAFKVEEIKKKNITFDTNFGLGSFFETAEEFLFLKAVLNQKGNVYFSPEIIVSHPEFSSGKNEGSDTLIYSRAALFYKLHGSFAYIWLAKYIFFLIRKKYIRFSEAGEKYKSGLAGIAKFREITQHKL